MGRLMKKIMKHTTESIFTSTDEKAEDQDSNTAQN